MELTHPLLQARLALLLRALAPHAMATSDIRHLFQLLQPVVLPPGALRLLHLLHLLPGFAFQSHMLNDVIFCGLLSEAHASTTTDLCPACCHVPLCCKHAA